MKEAGKHVNSQINTLRRMHVDYSPIFVSMIFVRQALQRYSQRAKRFMREQQHIQCSLLIACFSVLTIAWDALGDLESTGSGQDAPLKSYQIELLDIAFAANIKIFWEILAM